jgi:hypothetical protein
VCDIVCVSVCVCVCVCECGQMGESKPTGYEV